MSKRLDVVEKVHISALEHDLLFGQRSDRGDPLQIWQNRRLLDVDQEVQHHQGEAVCELVLRVWGGRRGGISLMQTQRDSQEERVPLYGELILRRLAQTFTILSAL